MRKPHHAWIVFFLLFLPKAFAFEAPRYDIQATVDTTQHRIDAVQGLTWTNNAQQPTDVLYFHIYPNRHYTPQEKSFLLRYASYFKMDPFPDGFQAGHLHIARVSSGGTALQYSIEGKDQTLLKVQLPKALNPGEQVRVNMDFTVDIPHAYGRFGWHEGITALARWYPIASVYNEEGWGNHPFYVYHRPFFSDAAFYNVQLTVGGGEVVIHSGDLVREETKDHTKTLTITTENPLRDFALAVSPLYGVAAKEVGGVQLKAFYLKGHEERAKEALQDAEDLMASYGKKFGAYPYKTFSIAPVHLGYGGEQMSNMIFIDTRVFDLPKLLNRHFDFLIAHETGHQWFYNVLGVDDYHQMWLEEGLNSYFLMEHLEDKYGAEAQVIDWGKLPRWVKLFFPDLTFRRAQDVRYKMVTRIGGERAIISPLSGFSEPSSIFALTYGKGSKVVAMLKGRVGEENFKKIFTRIFKEFRFQNLSVADLLKISEDVSGQELKPFFDQWLYTTKHLDGRIKGVKGGTVYLERAGGIVMPMDVRVEYSDGTHEDKVWDDAEETAHLSFPNKNITRVILDPDQKLLDIDRTNNSWPRHIHFKAVPLYHGLYDIPALLPDDGYNIVVGPEVSNGLGLKASFQKPYDYEAYAASDYDFNEQIQRTREGVEIKNIYHSQTSIGVEAMQTKDYDTGEDDLTSEKVYIRRELWPAAYNLTEANDHATFYALRNRTPEGSLLSGERIRNTSYLKHDESIVGMAMHIDRSQPHPDPKQGYAVDTLIENSGHWAGATQTFTRASIDAQGYVPVDNTSQMAYRLKYGWGSSEDKNLYELGGMDGLRGFDRKTVRGANALLGSAEYRFPVIDGLKLSVADHLLTLHKISGVMFFDAGEAWCDDFSDGKFQKDAGAGLRFHITLGSFLEDMIVRVDVAKAIDDKSNDAHTWFGLNHAF